MYIVLIHPKDLKSIFCKLEDIEEILSSSSSYDSLHGLSLDLLSNWDYSSSKEKFIYYFSRKGMEVGID